jgi:hypothetical protein
MASLKRELKGSRLSPVGRHAEEVAEIAERQSKGSGDELLKIVKRDAEEGRTTTFLDYGDSLRVTVTKPPK